MEKSRYVRFDWAIKRILRDKANKEVLEGLITVLLGEPVTITEILESEGNQDAREDKMNRVDVKAKTSKGEYIIVEVQLTKERAYSSVRPKASPTRSASARTTASSRRYTPSTSSISTSAAATTTPTTVSLLSAA